MNFEIDITRECNFNCLGCDRLCNLKKKNPSSIMNLDDINNIINNLKSYNLENLTIIGGEPTLNKNIIEIVDTLYENLTFKRFHIASNRSNMDILNMILSKHKDVDIYKVDGYEENTIKLSKLKKHRNFLLSPYEIHNPDYEKIPGPCHVHRYAGYGCAKINNIVYYSICCASITLCILTENMDILYKNLKDCVNNSRILQDKICKYCCHNCVNPYLVKDNQTVSECFKSGLEKYINE